MSIKWSDALLAGAAGIADYSNKVKQQRQERLDRARQLQENMAMIQAKSDFAYRYEQYRATEDLYTALGATDPKSKLGQYILQSKLNPKVNSDEIVARISAGHSVELPKRLAAPKFEMNTIGDYVATSPAQDWIRKYTGRDQQLPDASMNFDKLIAQEQDKAAIAEQKRQEAIQAGQKALDIKNNNQKKETDISIPRTEEPRPQVPETPEQEKESILNAFKTQPKQELVFKEQQGARGQQLGKQYDIFDKNTGELIKTVFSPSGKSSIVRAPDLVYIKDGRKIIQERGFDVETGKTIYTAGHYEVDNPSDNTSPMRFVATGTVKQFMSSENKDGTMGQFHLIFPEDELDNVTGYMDEHATGAMSFLFGESDKKIQEYKVRLANNFLNIRQNSTLLTNEDSEDPEVLKEVQDYWKARAYLQTFGEETLTDMLRKQSISKSLFEGAEVKIDPVFQRILKNSDLSAFTYELQDPNSLLAELQPVALKTQNNPAEDINNVGMGGGTHF